MNYFRIMKTKVLFVAGILGLGLMLTGCDGCKGNGGNGLAYEWCTVDYEDSIKAGESTAYQEMHIDFPANQDPDKADKGTIAALAWIREQVMARSFPSFEGEKLDTAVEFGIDQVERFAEPFVKSCGKQGLDRMYKTLTENEDFSYGFDFMNMLQIELLENTQDYLTMAIEYDIYTGGAHGSQYLSGISFGKEDGARLGWNLVNLDKKAELVELMKNGLKEYLSTPDNPIKTDEQLMENLLLFDDPDTPEDELAAGVPLPSNEPYLTRNGLNFVYQEYEVTAYCYGRPDVTIPLKTLQEKGLLTELGKKLIKD